MSANSPSHKIFSPAEVTNIRKDVTKKALEQCKPFQDKFAECQKEYRLMSVLSCRESFNNYNDCLREKNSEAIIEGEVIRLTKERFELEHK